MAVTFCLSAETLRPNRSRGASLASLLTAGLLQTVAGALLVVLPLLGAPALPEPHRSPPPFILFVKPAPPPAARESAPREREKIPTISAHGSRRFLAPADIPLGIPDEIGGEPEGLGVEGGLPVGLGAEIVFRLPPGRQEPSKPVRPGGDIKPPRRIKYVVPIYPELAKKARVEGIVILEAIIDPSGQVSNLRVLRSVPLLDDAALSAVQQWHYEPTLLNGVSVPIVMTVTVQFELARGR